MASRFWVGGTGTWDNSTTTHWSSTSGGAGGASVPGSSDTVTLDGSSGGGTVTLNYSPTILSITMGAFTGTFDDGGNNPTMGNFSNTGTATRTLTMTGTWTLTGNNTTIWSMATITNLTFNKSTHPIVCNYSGATGTRTISSGNISPSDLTVAPDFNITAGTDIISLANSRFGHLDFTGFKGSVANNTRIIYGNVTLDPGMTLTAGSASTQLGNDSGTSVITTRGLLLDFPISIVAAGATVQLADSLNMGTSRTLTHSSGTFDLNNKNVTCGTFVWTGSTTRTILMGSSTFTCTGTGTVWSANTTNSTFTQGTSTIIISDSSSSSKTFSGGGVTYNNLFLSGNGTGVYTISGSNTFNTLKTIPGLNTINFTAGTTTTTTTLILNGNSNDANDRLTLQSTSGGNPWTLSVASGTVQSNFVTISDSTATGGASFIAVESSNGGGNSGWKFQNLEPTYSRLAKTGRVAKSGRIAVSGRVPQSF